MKHWSKQFRFRKLRVTSGKPKGPPDQLVCAVGDIHGQLKCLKRLVERFEENIQKYESSQEQMVFLGDYVDRGLEVRGVLDYLIELRSRRKCVFLRGNHEQILLNFLSSPDVGEEWIRFGGLETLAAYGVGFNLLRGTDIDWLQVHDRFCSSFPEKHREFLESTDLCHSAGDFFFVHAGIDPARSFSDQSAHDLLYARGKFLNNKDVREKIVIHGHSHVTKPEIRRNRIGIDTGAFATNVLSAVLIWNQNISFIES